jgi:MFS family permease
MTYEGARGITGPFLGSLGASAAVVGVVAGLGELAGYALRSASGYLADRSHKYWLVILVGYLINMLAVPALALAGAWPFAAVLIVLERAGRAIRRPAVEAMLSHAGQSIGRGWVFGLNEAMDQGGATVGPLLAAWMIHRHGGGYHPAFAVLLMPALLCLGTLGFARVTYPRPQELERRTARPLTIGNGFSRTYWIYLAGGALVAAGFADFSLVAFHVSKVGIVAPSTIPLLYAVAMATGAIAALVIGRSLDRCGWPVLVVGFGLSALFAPFAFGRTFTVVLAGIVLWGIGMGAQDSALKAVLSGIVPPDKRSTAFGVFDTGFGIAWFAGSAVMGFVYERSTFALVILSVVLQLAALPFLSIAVRREGEAA